LTIVDLRLILAEAGGIDETVSNSEIFEVFKSKPGILLN
jgi:hypothetical protein